MQKIKTFLFNCLTLMCYILIGFYAFVVTMLGNIENVSVYVLWISLASFVLIFFKTKIIKVIPLILLGITIWLSLYVDTVEKWELCSYKSEWIVGKCECDGLILNYFQVGYCQWDRLSCSVSPGYIIDPFQEISCEDHNVPNNFYWK